MEENVEAEEKGIKEVRLQSIFFFRGDLLLILVLNNTTFNIFSTNLFTKR